MDNAYIILAHKNLKQLNRLINRLDDGRSFFFVHIDSKVHPDEFATLDYGRERMRLIKRINTKWADFSIVQATLNALEAISLSNIDFRTITLLSGQDYPIKSNEYIRDFFANSSHEIFIDYNELPNFEKWTTGGGMYRINKYFFGLKEYQLFASRTVNFLSNFIPPLRRNHPGLHQPYAGSQWWTINSYSMHYILNFIRANPDYINFHRATFAPDEVFFQTILLNATDTRISAAILNDNKRFIRWQSSSTAHPELIKSEDMKDLAASEALFARKFDLEEFPEVFDLIDEYAVNTSMPVPRQLLQV